MESLSLTCFGVGDGWPSIKRNHSSFYYETSSFNFMIDCGEPVSRTFKESGADCNAIDRIVISHLHCDHVGGLFMLLQGFWLEKRTRPLTVCMPSDGIKPVRSMLDAACIFSDLLPFKLRFEPLSVGRTIVSGTTRLTPFPSTHLEGLRRRFQKKYPQSFAAFTFLIETDYLRIGHSGDIGHVTDLDPLLDGPLDLLVCELAHFEAAELLRHLGGRSIKRLLFVHLNRAQWADLDLNRRLAATMLPEVETRFAHDGHSLSLSPVPEPSPNLAEIA